MRTVLTKGRHAVLCVVMDNSKIPKLFKKFDCIYAWNWKTKPTKTLENIRNSLLGMTPVSTFKWRSADGPIVARDSTLARII